MKRFELYVGAWILLMASCTERQNFSILPETNQVIEATKVTCSFVPTVASIASILGAQGTPAAAALADQICSEVNKLPVLETGEEARTVSITIGDSVVEGLLY